MTRSENPLVHAAVLAAQTLANLLVISVIAFLIIKAMPEDPVKLAIYSWNLPATDATIAALRHQWGFDRPLVQQYGLWLLHFVEGDWGLSFRTGGPVLGEFMRRLPVSLGLGLSGLALAALLAVPLGQFSAGHPSGVADRASRLLAIVAQSVPVFWLALILLWLIGVRLHLITVFSAGPSAFSLSVMLLTLQSLGPLSRIVRRDLRESAKQPYFRTALAKGLTLQAAFWHHAGRHALYALVASLRSEAGRIIGGTATLEVLFGLPGISQFLVQSVAARDYFVLQAYVMVMAIWMAAMNGAAALALRWLDPRVP